MACSRAKIIELFNQKEIWTVFEILNQRGDISRERMRREIWRAIDTGLAELTPDFRIKGKRTEGPYFAAEA